MRISPYSTPLSHLLLFSMFASQFALTPSSQIEILHDLYLATNGKQWNWKDETIYGPRWSFSLYNTSSQSDPCNSWNNTISWQGITCTYPPSLCQFSSCSIKSINLIDYAMNGTIPDSLYTLSSLEELKFSGNYLLGSVSSLIGSLSNLDTYCVDQNSLTGSLPSTIGLLSNLATLEVHFNSLTGSIPPTLGSLSKLELLYLYRNLLSGPIPSSIGSLSRLTYLIFFSNFITGSLPSSLGSLTNLLYLYSHTNALSGPLPSTLGSLSNVKYILSYSNLLEESIPSSLGSLLELRQLDLSNNRLTGALPSSLALLSNLETLIASTNHFEKEIPSELGVLTQLFYFIFYFNQLTGSIPETFGSLSQLRYLYLFSNRLTGTIPSVLASLRFMTDLSVDGNMLTGSIPSSIAKLKLLEYLAVNDNVLTGFIPPSLGDLSYLQFFLVSSNQLTGTIPTSLGRFSKLMYFYVDSNHLSGSLPSSLNQLNKVITFHCYNNHLHGTLPLKLDSFASIERFFIQRNHFQGTLTTFFTNSSRLSNVPLTNFDISGNLFTGSIPEEIFRIPPLESIALSVNKFQHTIPNSICDAINMKVMSLDGLGAAIEGPFLPFTSITIDRRMKGGIPDCLWRLSRLEELSLAGNGLTGTISKTASMYSLRNLTLSHNYLSGRIPNWIIEKNLTVLDLSNNKLTGELEGLQFFPYNNISSRTLKLRVNRLSGPLPDNLQQYSSLNILAGNIFGCSNIPSNDKKSEWYVCGSSEFDHSIYTLLGIICLIFFGGSLVAISWISLKLTHSLNFFSVTILTSYNLLLKEMSYYIVAKTSSLEFSHSEILKFGRALASIKQMTGFILAGCLICSIPLYVLKSLNSDTTTNEEELEYVTHSHQYRWHWTAAFLSGPLPAGLILMTSFMTLIILVLYEPRLLNVEANSTDIVEDQGSITYSQFAAASPKDSSSSLPIRNSFSPVNGPNIQDKSEKLFQVIYVSLMLLLNIGIVGTANGLYVWSTSQNSSKSIRLLSQLGLSVFKIVWRVCVRFMFLQLKRDSDFRLVIWLSCCLGVLNSVVIPCIATALTNPSCYQMLIIEPPEISSRYSYSSCTSWLILVYPSIRVCQSSTTMEMEVLKLTPPFTYSYQCGPTLLTTYIPVYMYTMIIQLIVEIGKSWILSHREMVEKSTWIVKLLQQQSLKSSTLLTTILNNLVLLLTFGLTSPILCLCIGISTYVSITSWLVAIGKSVFKSLNPDRPSKNLSQRVSEIQLATRDASRSNSISSSPHDLEIMPSNSSTKDHQILLQITSSPMMEIRSFLSCQWLILSTSCVFITFIAWEMVGDEVGWRASIWVPLTGGLLFLIIGTIKFLQQRCLIPRNLDKTMNSAVILSSEGR